MATEEHIQVGRKGLIGTIRINRPEKSNALTMPMLHAILAALESFAGDDETRAIVLSGAGRNFCAGRDIREISTFHGQGVEAARAGMKPLMDLALAFTECEKLTVAAVEGHALGLGAALAANTDLTVAASDASFAMAEARRGLAASASLIGLNRVLPYKVVLELIVTGDAIDCQRAHEVGLVNRVAEPGRAEADAIEWLAGFLDRDHGFIRECKAGLRMVRSLPPRDAVSYLGELSAVGHATGGGSALIKTFLRGER